MILCTIFDSVSKTHSNPYVFPNVDSAKREVKNIALDSSSYLGRNPDDYSVVVCADYDPTASCPIVMRDVDDVEQYQVADLLTNKEVM